MSTRFLSSMSYFWRPAVALCALFVAHFAVAAAQVTSLAPAPGAPPLRPENLVGLKALAEEHDLEFPWDEWEALLEAAADDSALLRVIDRDGDGYADGYEIAQGTDPLDPDSRPALGDVNDDGVTNNLDAVAFFHHLLGVYDGPFDVDRADIRQDGEVRNTDAVTLFNWLLGDVPFLPFPEGIHLVRQDGTGHFTTIQSAIDAATTGSTVLVYPGTYYENLVMPGYDFIMTGINPYAPDVTAQTIINGGYQDRVIAFSGLETSAFVLSGLTIINPEQKDVSAPDYAVGGIAGNGTKATIHFCNIRNIYMPSTEGDETVKYGGLYRCDGIVANNTISGIVVESAEMVGMGRGVAGMGDCSGIVYGNVFDNNSGLHGAVAWSESLVFSNRFSNNKASVHDDGSASVGLSKGVLINNMFSGNDATGMLWGGIVVIFEGLIVNNTFDNNMSIVVHRSMDAVIVNCIIWNTIDFMTGDIHPMPLKETGIPSYSCIEGWEGPGEGNFDEDPIFVNPEIGDLRLLPNSPCIDAGRRIEGLEQDYYGNWRPVNIYNGERGDGSGYDIGFYEYYLK